MIFHDSIHNTYIVYVYLNCTCMVVRVCCTKGTYAALHCCDLTRSKQYCLQLHTLWYHMMINVVCLQASQKSSEVPIYSVVDNSKKKNRKKNGSTPAAAVRNFHFLNAL